MLVEHPRLRMQGYFRLSDSVWWIGGRRKTKRRVLASCWTLHRGENQKMRDPMIKLQRLDGCRSGSWKAKKSSTPKGCGSVMRNPSAIMKGPSLNCDAPRTGSARSSNPFCGGRLQNLL